MGSRRASALQMAENRHTNIELWELLAHAVCIVEGTAFWTLRNDDDARALRLANAVFHKSGELVGTRHILWDNGSLGTAGNSGVLSQEAGIAAHHLDEEDALMALGRIANAVYALHDGIQGCVVADGGVGAIEVVVDGTRQANTADVEFAGKLHGTC